jgi:putative peptidoglycan lipid II flippase
MSFFKSVSNIGFWTILSRISGFFREILTAKFIGSGAIMDAIILSMKLPAFLRRLTAEGAFSAAFIPLFSKILNQKGQESALKFASVIQTLMLAFLLILTFLFIIFASQIVPFLLPGLKKNSERLAFVITFGRFSFPFIVFISLTALYGGILNSVQRFTSFAASPFFGNLFIIFFVLLLIKVSALTSVAQIGFLFIIAVTLSGLVQLLTVLIACWRGGYMPSFSLCTRGPYIRSFFKKLLPAVFSSGITQVNLFIGIFIASWLPTGSISFLNYADRLIQLPTSIVGTALSVALLPLLSKKMSLGEVRSANVYQNLALSVSILVSAFVIVFLTGVPHLIVSLVFKRGAFNANAAFETAKTLFAYSWGLPAYLMIKILSVRAFAKGLTKLPLMSGFLSMLVDIALSLLLLKTFKQVGIAFATSIAAWVNVIALSILLNRHKQWSWPRETLVFMLKMFAFSLVNICLFWLILTVYPLKQISAVTSVFFLTGVGVIVILLFYVFTRIFCNTQFQQFSQFFKNKLS